LSWRWIFLAIALLAVPAALLVRPALANFTGDPSRMPAPDSRRRIAWAFGAAAGVSALHYGGQQRGVVALAIVGAGVVFVARFTSRLLPPGTARMRRGLPSVIALRGIASAAFLEAEIFVPLMLIRERGLSPAGAGATLTLAALSWSAGSWYQGRDGRPLPGVRLLQLGMTFIGLGIARTGLALIHPFRSLSRWWAGGLRGPAWDSSIRRSRC